MTKVVILFACLIVSVAFADEYHSRFHRKSSKATQLNEDVSYWKNKGKEEIEKAKAMQMNEAKAKNIIIFVGDGMSLPTITASRIYKAQKYSNFDGSVMGEESSLFFEKLPHVALSKTYSIDGQTPDSAATASAMFTGVKTNSGTMGFDHKIMRGNVSSIDVATKVKSIMKVAQEAGKDTGFVTTTRITHATPASLYAHSADRDWECYRHIEDVQGTVHEIAWQLMNEEPGKSAKVMMGGGKKTLMKKVNETMKGDDDYSNSYEYNCYTEGTDFIQTFLKESQSNKVVETKTDLLAVEVDKVDRLLGLFSQTHCIFDHERRAGSVDIVPDSPSLISMTKKAIEMLQKNQEKGFFLMVEGGRIDHAHHDSWVNAALDETVAFDEAIEAAYHMTDPKDTLIIVTADHGHTMTMSGYPQRGADVRSYVEPDPEDPGENAEDGLPYSILSYANGEGFNQHVTVDENGNWTRKDLRNLNMTDFYFLSPSMIMRSYESHSGADVGIFASGPFAHYFHGVHEQTFIYYVMAYSACMGDEYKDEPHCKVDNSGGKVNLSLFAFMMIALNTLVFQ